MSWGALIFYFCAVVYQKYSKGAFRVIREGSHIDLDEFGIVITICSLLVPILLYTKAKDDTEVMKKELDIKFKGLEKKYEEKFEVLEKNNDELITTTFQELIKNKTPSKKSELEELEEPRGKGKEDAI